MKTLTNPTYQRAYRCGALAALALPFCLSPEYAHAATGSGTFLSGFLTWTEGPVVTTISTLGVLAIGLTMLSMRAAFGSILIVCVGIWVISNAGNLSTMFAS